MVFYAAACPCLASILQTQRCMPAGVQRADLLNLGSGGGVSGWEEGGQLPARFTAISHVPNTALSV